MQFCRFAPDPDRHHRNVKAVRGCQLTYSINQRRPSDSEYLQLLSAIPPAFYIYMIGHKRAHYLLLLLYITFPCAPNGGYPKVRSPQSSKIKQCKNSGTAVKYRLHEIIVLFFILCFFFVVVRSLSVSFSDFVCFALFRVCVLSRNNTKWVTAHSAQSSSLA